MIQVNDKTALVTGASQGLGKGIALTLASAGANLAVTHLPTAEDTVRAEAVVQQIIALGRQAIALPLDVTDTASVKQCAQRALEHFPRLTVRRDGAG